MNCRAGILTSGRVGIATIAIAMLSCGSAMAAGIDVTLAPDAEEYVVGDTVLVSVLATPEAPLVGYGFDLVMDDPSILTYEGFDAGDAFTRVSSRDGDGLAALSFMGGMTGPDLLIGVVTYTAVDAGEVTLDLGITAGDLSEGFGSNGEGIFLDLNSSPATITVMDFPVAGDTPVIPEPATMAMLAGGLLLLRRRW